MNEELFRKKSLDKIKSPESLDDYIRVSSPGVWLLLASIIVLMIGAVVWGIFGHIDSTIPSTVYAENGNIVCYVSEEDIYSVKNGSTVKFKNHEAVISEIGEKNDDSIVCKLTTEDPVEDGYYEGKVIVKSYSPISFILN